MRTVDVARLSLLGALWGGSFIFMRIVAPALGAFGTACARLLIAGCVLSLGLKLLGRPIPWRRHAPLFLGIGVLNSAIPFTLFAYAALHIPAGYSAVLNATAPMFGLILGVLLHGERSTIAAAVGALVGLVGVGVIAGLGPVEPTPVVLLAFAACLVASLCYAVVGRVIQKRASGLDPTVTAAASQVLAGAVLLPLGLATSGTAPVTPLVVGCTLGLALLSSALAYLLYYRLIADCGPTRALTVTYLIPAFGVIWGAVFLGESITLAMLVGIALVIAGTALVVRTPKGASPPAKP